MTEYLIKYCELIFTDKLPPFITAAANTCNSKLSPSPSEGSGDSDTPRVATKMRPKSLAISTPTKLLSLEEARNRALNQARVISIPPPSIPPPWGGGYWSRRGEDWRR